MNREGPVIEVVSPWGSPGLTTEEDLRAAQEYFFQTHATHSRMVAEGRTATGFMKSYTRRKLEKEMGEDFRMYTGQQLGEGEAGEESQGIRGELNSLLRFVYQRIAPTEPITSPLQEDVTILRHPHGALEVCFGMVFFYGSLLKKHLTLASNRRRVLKSILDEELFKWVWRLSINYMLSDGATRVNLQDYFLTTGLPFLPAERQRASVPQKLFEIGTFMLGKTLEDSPLRFPLCYYFVAYLRAMQSEVLGHPTLGNAEEVYGEVMRRKQMDPITHPLVAIDVLMNMSGNSSESFDDILRDEAVEVEKFIPAAEAAFIRHYDPYADVEAFGDAVRAALPAIQKSEAVGDRGAGSLAMRLLLVLRATSPAVRTGILDHIPAPVLVMLRNRIMNGPQDDSTRVMGERLKAALDTRSQRGEQLVVPAANRGGMPGVATVAVRPDAPAAKHAVGAAGSPRVEPVNGAARPAAPQAAAPQSAAPAAPAAKAAAAPPTPAAPAKAAAAAAAPEPAPKAAAMDALLDQRLLIGWRMAGERLSVFGMTPREVFSLVGPEPRLVVHWVMMALQTGQVFDFPAASVNKELIERLVKAVLAKGAGLPAPRFGKPQVAQIVNDLKDAPPQKALQALLLKGQLGDLNRPGGRGLASLDTLAAKFGTGIGEFLRSPSKDEFRDLRMGLSAEEKQLVQVLQKLARLGG